MALSKTDSMKTKILGADAAAVDSARSAEAAAVAPHAERWAAVPHVMDDEWGVRREGEEIGMSIAQMVWSHHAHLIAAAPEMYQALKQIVEHEQIDGTGIRYVFDWHSPFGIAARAAIQKAEGR